MSTRRSGRKKVMLETKVKKSISKDKEHKEDNIKIPKERITMEYEKALPKHNWERTYKLIQEQRSTITAPVDEIGCSELANKENPTPVWRYQVLIGHMLSSQTKDEVTHKAMLKLQEFGLTPEKISEIDEDKLIELIKGVRFYNRKAKHIKEATEIIIKKYEGDIPETVKELTKFKGVGMKMAVNTVNLAWGQTVGIGVDVHLHRICNRLGWVKTDSPDETREDLREWLPKDKWKEINPLLSGFGQMICTARNPKCAECKVSHLCPSSTTKEKQEELKEE